MTATAVEICIDASQESLARSALTAAYMGGADRIEVCASMDVDGITPPRQRIRLARDIFVDRPGVICMIRPRSGDFFYSPAEIDVMLGAIECAAEDGADGVALGALHPAEHRLDLDAMKSLTARAHALRLAVTLHRAFDATMDRVATLEAAVELGVQRILSSGTAWGDGKGAQAGLATLKQLCIQARGRIEIIAAGGIAPHSAPPVVNALHGLGSPFSVHAFSGVCQQGITAAPLVRAIKTII